MIDGLIAGGAPAEVIEAVQARLSSEQDDCEVWEENWESVMLFLAVSTQWIISSLSGSPTGINYAGLQAAMGMAGIKKKRRAALFNDVRIMEAAALKVFRDKK